MPYTLHSFNIIVTSGTFQNGELIPFNQQDLSNHSSMLGRGQGQWTPGNHLPSYQGLILRLVAIQMASSDATIVSRTHETPCSHLQGNGMMSPATPHTVALLPTIFVGLQVLTLSSPREVSICSFFRVRVACRLTPPRKEHFSTYSELMFYYLILKSH